MTVKMIEVGNDTTVTATLLAGALCVVIWWLVPQLFPGVTDVPEAVVVASGTILTALLQYILPAMPMPRVGRDAAPPSRESGVINPHLSYMLGCLAMLALVLTVGFLSGCAAGPRADIKTPTDAVAATIGEIKSTAAATADSAKQGAITKGQALAIQAKLQTALDAAKLARVAVVQDANSDSAIAALQTVNAILIEIRSELSAEGQP